MFLVGVFVVAVLSGGTASVAGFGIGSLLTPILALRYGTAVAVAAVAIPHVAATALRCWRLRANIDWAVVKGFGLLSALGGLTGALMYTRFSNDELTLTLGLLLVSTALATILDLPSRVRVSGVVVGLLGVLSGLFGGLAGNQGGLRAAAMLSFGLPPVRYVATATATAMLVDAMRTPIYVWRAGAALESLTASMAVATVGVLIGTLLGERILLGLSMRQFRYAIAVLIGLLGIWLVVQGLD
jgi:uncharacterized membrane protein YfcA